MELDFNKGKTVYVIDTSGLILLDFIFKKNNPVFEAIWEEIEELITQDRFKTIDFVEVEINSYEGKEDFLKKWIENWKKVLVESVDSQILNTAIPIINEEYDTGFFDAKKLAVGKEEADPYLIAYCKVHNYTLITNENPNKPNKIPAVSKKNGVRCIDIFKFLNERELKMVRKQE